MSHETHPGRVRERVRGAHRPGVDRPGPSDRHGRRRGSELAGRREPGEDLIERLSGHGGDEVLDILAGPQTEERVRVGQQAEQCLRDIRIDGGSRKRQLQVGREVGIAEEQAGDLGGGVTAALPVLLELLRQPLGGELTRVPASCLLYTSDAADE